MDKRIKKQAQSNVSITSIATKVKKTTNLRRLYDRLRGGHVLRYHTRPEIADGQNVAAHTWRAMVILQTLFPDISKSGLLHMMYHDVAEAETGDIPATTKWKYDDLSKLMLQIETEYEQKIGIGPTIINVSQQEQEMCDIADKLELVFHCYRLMQQGNSLAEDVFIKGCNYIQDRYEKQDYYAHVIEIIKDLQGTRKIKLEKLF